MDRAVLMHAVARISADGVPQSRWLVLTDTHVHILPPAPAPAAASPNSSVRSFSRPTFTLGDSVESVQVAEFTHASVSKYWDSVIVLHTEAGPDLALLDDGKEDLLGALQRLRQSKTPTLAQADGASRNYNSTSGLAVRTVGWCVLSAAALVDDRAADLTKAEARPSSLALGKQHCFPIGEQAAGGRSRHLL